MPPLSRAGKPRCTGRVRDLLSRRNMFPREGLRLGFAAFEQLRHQTAHAVCYDCDLASWKIYRCDKLMQIIGRARDGDDAACTCG